MKWFIAALAAVVVLLQYRIWVSPDGAREVLRLDRAVAEQRAENERLQARNQQLFAEVKDLKQGFAAVEERARAELGLVAPNETYYQVVPPEDTPTGLVEEDAPAADSPTALASAAH
ncbi:MAG: cell division protein FtsB [Pseudomonadota bacterium]|nr:cell division protein FtsB [Pseudomonadota bacterium]